MKSAWARAGKRAWAERTEVHGGSDARHWVGAVPHQGDELVESWGSVGPERVKSKHDLCPRIAVPGAEPDYPSDAGAPEGPLDAVENGLGTELGS